MSCALQANVTGRKSVSSLSLIFLLAGPFFLKSNAFSVVVVVVVVLHTFKSNSLKSFRKKMNAAETLQLKM